MYSQLHLMALLRLRLFETNCRKGRKRRQQTYSKVRVNVLVEDIVGNVGDLGVIALVVGGHGRDAGGGRLEGSHGREAAGAGVGESRGGSGGRVLESEGRLETGGGSGAAEVANTLG